MSKRMRKYLAALLAAAMVLSLAACGGSSSSSAASTAESSAAEPAASSEQAAPASEAAPAESSEAEAPAEEAPAEEPAADGNYKDTIVFATDIEPPTLNGLTARTTTSAYMVIMETVQMVNELVTAPADSPYAEEVAMALITDYEVSEDELTWTFTTKEGMKFADGDDLTAQDIVDTFHVLVPWQDADPAAAPIGHYKGIFKSVDFIDDTHFSITTENKCPAMLRILCSFSSGVWDSKLLESYPLEELGMSPETMNASGPYQLIEWVPGDHMLFEANPNYHTVSITGENAKTKYLKILFIPESSSREAALESGEVDVVYALTAESGDNLKMNPDMVVEATDDCSIYNMRFGCNDPIMSNVKVRHAINCALDTNAIAKALYGDYWYEITGFSSYVIWGFLDEGHIERDIDKAKSLLAEAGYPDGFDTQIYASTSGYKYVQLAEAISAQLKDIGINAEVIPVENSVYQTMISGTKIEDFNYPLFIKETGGRTREFGSVVHTWYETCTDGTNALNNNGFYSNEEVDKLSAEGNATMDDDARVEIFQKIQHICYVDDPPQVNIAGLVDIWAHSAKVKGIWMNAGGCIEFDQTVVEE